MKSGVDDQSSKTKSQREALAMLLFYFLRFPFVILGLDPRIQDFYLDMDSGSVAGMTMHG